MNEAGSKTWQVIGTVGIVVAAAVLAFGLYRLLRKGSTAETRWADARILVVALYPLGTGIKYLLIAPDFVRWHLSDVGFPAFVAFLVYLRVYLPKLYREYPEMKEDAGWRTYVAYQLNALKVTAVVCVAWELFSEVLFRLNDAPSSPVGRFDPIDLAAYALGLVACYGMTIMSTRHTTRWWVEHPILDPTQEAERREAERAARLAERAARRAERKKRG